jgi:hypothetical protein
MALCSCCVVFYAVCPSCHLVYHVPTSGWNPRPLALLRAALLSTPSCKGGAACRTHKGGADAALPSPRAVKPAARLCPGEAPGPRARHVSWVCAERPHCFVCVSAALSWLVCCYVCCRLPWAASWCLKPCCCFTPVGHSGGRSLAGLDDCNRAEQSKGGSGVDLGRPP